MKRITPYVPTDGANYDTSVFTKDDFAAARASWRRSLCGDSKTNSTDIAGIKALLEMIDADSELLRKEMNRSEQMPVLFGENPPKESGELKIQYDQIFRMALPYGTTGCRGYKNRELLSDIIFALDWMYDNMYGENLLTDSSFRSYKLYDWWDWYVGASQSLQNTLMIIAEDISEEEVKRYTIPVAFLKGEMITELNPASAMSRLTSLAPLAILREDRELLKAIYNDLEMLLEEHDSGDNMRRDWCCMTHGMPYNVVYGALNLSRVAKTVKLFNDTPLAFPLRKKYNLMNMLRYTFAPIMYNGRVLCFMNGRAMQSDDSAKQILESLHYLLGLFGDDEDREIKELIYRNSTPELVKEMLSTFDTGITLSEYRKINSIPGRFREAPKTEISTYGLFRDVLLNDSYKTEGNNLGYMWYSGDSAVQIRNGSMLGLRMFSKRVPGYESINNANGDGWYTCDGALYLYTPHTTDFSPDWWKNADKHLIPGTTVDKRVREYMNFRQTYKSSKSFVGGVALEKEFVTATMDYEAFHNETAGSSESNGYGREWPKHLSTLVAEKSYFMLDRVAVMLGTGISANDGYPVHTVVENRLLPDDKDAVLINGETLEIKAFEETRNDIRSIHIKNTGTYFFQKDAEVTVRIYKKGDAVYLAVMIEHGIDPNNESYAYALLPNCTARESAEYNPDDIEIIALTSDLHSVRERSSGLTGMVFRKAGRCGRISVKQPMVAMLKDDSGKIHLSVCEPTGECEVYGFEISGCSGAVSDENIQLEKTAAGYSCTVKCGSAHGRGFDISFK